MAWVYKIGVQESLTQAQMENNATEFYKYFYNKGATIEAICGMLGNIQQESGLNPGNKQTSSSTSGWGLIQWTPATILVNWCKKYKYKWYKGEVQALRIYCEGTGKKKCTGYWVPTPDYNYTWSEFISLTNVELATKAFLYERERASAEELQNRLNYANNWYTYLSGQPIPTPTPTPTSLRNHMPIYMMLRKL